MRQTPSRRIGVTGWRDISHSQVPERLRSLADDGVDWAVLTTKGRRFTAELLDGFDCTPLCCLAMRMNQA